MSSHKKRWTIESLDAKERAYGRQVNKKTIFKTTAVITFYSALSVALFVGPTHWYLAVAGAIFGFFYGFRRLLPMQVNQRYYEDGYQQRHEALSTLTQGMLDVNKLPQQVIRMARMQAQGEFYDDLLKLELAVTRYENDQTVTDAFQEISDKYADDVTFGFFMEQMNVAVTRGDRAKDSFSELNEDHILSYEQYLGHKKDRLARKKLFAILFNLILGIQAILIYVGVSASNWADFNKIYFGKFGFIIGAVYLAIILWQKYTFDKHFDDVSVMSFD